MPIAVLLALVSQTAFKGSRVALRVKTASSWHLRLEMLFCFLIASPHLLIQFAVAEPRKQAYADFYKKYDSVKEFNAMREAGVFESVRPSGE